MDSIENLKKLGFELPEPSTPGGSYVSVNVRANIAYIAIQFPILNEEYLYQGRLGNDISTEEGYKAIQLCALNVLAQINKKVGFENLVGLNHIDAYFQSGENWDDSPKVVKRNKFPNEFPAISEKIKGQRYFLTTELGNGDRTRMASLSTTAIIDPITRG